MSKRIIAGLGAVIVLGLFLGLVYQVRQTDTSSAAQIIGGSDGSSAIYLKGRVNWFEVVPLTVLAAVLVGLILKTNKEKSKEKMASEEDEKHHDE